MSIEFSIDGVSVTAREGQSVVDDVAADAGVYIPTLCYLPSKPRLGTCRVCSVQVNGAVVAGVHGAGVATGMTVEVDEPEPGRMRREGLVELLFAEGNHNCPSCEKSGRCTPAGGRLRGGHAGLARSPTASPLGSATTRPERIWLERDRCIFCQRCVEFVRDASTGQKIFSISGRGGELPDRDRRRTGRRDAARTGPLGRRHLSRRRHPRQGSRLRRADRAAQVRRRMPSATGRSTRQTRQDAVTDETLASHELPATPLDPARSAARAGKIQVSTMIACAAAGDARCRSSTWTSGSSRCWTEITIRPVLAHRHQADHRALRRSASSRAAWPTRRTSRRCEHFREQLRRPHLRRRLRHLGRRPVAAQRRRARRTAWPRPTSTRRPRSPAPRPIIPLHPEIPRLTTKVHPCHEVVQMDYFIPGCPPDARRDLRGARRPGPRAPGRPAPLAQPFD